MIYAVEMGSGLTIYIQSIIKCALGIQKLLGGEPHRGNVVSYMYFFCKISRVG
jgi:hypothetical protein